MIDKHVRYIDGCDTNNGTHGTERTRQTSRNEKNKKNWKFLKVIGRKEGKQGKIKDTIRKELEKGMQKRKSINYKCVW